MFSKIIESAFESGQEIIVHLRGMEDAFRGSVRDFDGQQFTLFHSGCCSGLLWAFKLEDVLTCALIIPVPSDDHLHGIPEPSEQDVNTESL